MLFSFEQHLQAQATKQLHYMREVKSRHYQGALSIPASPLLPDGEPCGKNRQLS